MSSLWLRKVRAIFSGGGNLVVNPGIETNNQQRIEFNIEKSISSTANELVVRIYNLSERSRNAVGRELSDIEIQAGHIPRQGLDLTGTIFLGQIEDFTHDREGPDIVTTVRASDGGKAIRKSTINKTYPAGTPPEAVIEDVYAEFEKNGVKRGEFLFPPMEPFIRPYTVSGDASREANVIGRSKGFYWSIQNQVMEVIPGDKFLPLITKINRNTGMIGYPQITDNGIRVVALINPEVRPNRVIAVKSEFVEAANGEFRVGRMDYKGDNRDGDFEMIIHGESVFGGAVEEGAQ